MVLPSKSAAIRRAISCTRFLIWSDDKSTRGYSCDKLLLTIYSKYSKHGLNFVDQDCIAFAVSEGRCHRKAAQPHNFAGALDHRPRLALRGSQLPP